MKFFFVRKNFCGVKIFSEKKNLQNIFDVGQKFFWHTRRRLTLKKYQWHIFDVQKK